MLCKERFKNRILYRLNDLSLVIFHSLIKCNTCILLFIIHHNFFLWNNYSFNRYTVKKAKIKCTKNQVGNRQSHKKHNECLTDYRIFFFNFIDPFLWIFFYVFSATKEWPSSRTLSRISESMATLWKQKVCVNVCKF